MRLTEATADRLPVDVRRPGYDRREQRRGIVHLGIGAFHRAHQAVYTDEAMGAGDRDWAITGVSLRSPGVRDALAPQDGLYTVTAQGSEGGGTRLIGSIRDVLVAPEHPNAVVDALADADTAIVTLTITEKGYRRRPDGLLDEAAVAAGDDGFYPFLARAFARRRANGVTGLTLVCCDNLAENGRVLSGLVSQYLHRFAPEEADWFERHCACPSTMVDRIVPAVGPAEIAAAEERLGLRDEAAIVTEPFRQWVIENRFASRRPRWETAGAQLVDDVRPYETAKLRMLNGAHSALAYLGLARGHAHVHAAIADPAIRPVVERLMRTEAAASLEPAPDQDLDAYATALLARFGNADLPHRLAQIATDGSQKIAPRWLEPLAINRPRDLDCSATLTALAAWILHVRGDAAPVDDPLAERLADLWRSQGAEGIVDALFGPAGLYSGTWTASGEDRERLRAAVAA